MTNTSISKSSPPVSFTLPNLPEEFLYITDGYHDETPLDEICQVYPFAISDVYNETVVAAQRLTHGEDVKEVYCLELPSKGIKYEPGDTIGVVPVNSKEDVEKLLQQLELIHLIDKKCRIGQIPGRIKKNTAIPSFLNKITSFRFLFETCLDIRCLPKKLLIRILAEYTTNSEERRLLEELCSKEGSKKYISEILETKLTFLELLLRFPTCCPPVIRLIEQLPKLLPRPYSIASSPLSSSDKVRIIFSVTKFQNDIIKEGVCTGMLKSIANEIENNPVHKNGKLKMFYRKSHGFVLPENHTTPLILIAPGTGIAPFLGFLEHRKEQNIKGNIWLFYGCRYREKDFLFEKELEDYIKSGMLSKLCMAFSRDKSQDAKYVQDNLRKYGKEVGKLIFEQDAIVYVCGDAKNMRTDIFNSIVDIVQNYKGVTNKEAIATVKTFQKTKRYIEDSWT